MKGRIAWLLGAALALLALAHPTYAGQKLAANVVEKLGMFSKAPLPSDPEVPTGRHASITTADGEIVIELFPEIAPNTVANFKALAGKGFYDGLVFHRVIQGFMAQGGDPFGSGMGGPGYTVKAEFSRLPHQRGTVAMARSEDPDSAGSQFYICFEARPELDGRYTVFGQVIRGMSVVDRIKVGTVMNKVSVLP